MNWYHREEARYVEYGSSFSASRQFGVLRSLTDTVYRMNAEHLSHDVETVFESLDDADVRTAGTTYLIYRGRHQHEVANESALARIVTSTLFRRTIDGPQELFYADLYASARPAAAGQLGLPGVRDQHTGCVGAYLVEHDLFDFLLFSLPDNDAWSHRNGPARAGDLDRRRRPPARAADARRRRPRRVPRRARRDRLPRTTRRRRSRSGSGSTRRSPTSTSPPRARRARSAPRSRSARRSARR